CPLPSRRRHRSHHRPRRHRRRRRRRPTPHRRARFARPSLPVKHARTSVLDIAYEDSGPADGIPVFLMHGFPYDPRTYDGVVPLLTARGCRTIVPYLRGYGPTRFLSADTMRSGEQAALGNDLKEMMDGLGIQSAEIGRAHV